jgi:chromosome partitioning protein
MKIIAVANQKGGVGKSTTTISVAHYLAKSGKRVLVVDLDPQGNTTSGLGVDKQQLEHTTYDVLQDYNHLESAITKTEYGVWLMPANQSLAMAEVNLVSTEGREQKLKQALSRVTFDYVFIDCPPSLGLLTINALTASTHVAIPVQAEYYALEGLGQLLETIRRVRQALNPDLELLGVLLTMFDHRTTLSTQVHEEIKKHFPGKLFETIIPRNVRLAEAPSHGQPIGEHDKWSKGARAYKKLSKEITKRLST